ncbi:hypothetical protein LTR28_002977, partial [Elasticomyces elasticus]
MDELWPRQTTPAAPATPIPTSAFNASNANMSDLATFQNMSTLQWDEAVYSLPTSQTGCYRPGAIPMALAANDTCNLGFI